MPQVLPQREASDSEAAQVVSPFVLTGRGFQRPGGCRGHGTSVWVRSKGKRHLEVGFMRAVGLPVLLPSRRHARLVVVPLLHVHVAQG